MSSFTSFQILLGFCLIRSRSNSISTHIPRIKLKYHIWGQIPLSTEPPHQYVILIFIFYFPDSPLSGPTLRTKLLAARACPHSPESRLGVQTLQARLLSLILPPN